jgi:hypothetical protein
VSFEEYVIEIHQIAEAMGDDLGAIDDEIWRDDFEAGKASAEAWNRFYSRLAD